MPGPEIIIFKNATKSFAIFLKKEGSNLVQTCCDPRLVADQQLPTERPLPNQRLPTEQPLLDQQSPGWDDQQSSTVGQGLVGDQPYTGPPTLCPLPPPPSLGPNL
jgi:hypothetical protein